MTVSLFEGEDAGGMALGAMQIDAPLLPGAFAELVWDVEAEAGDDARSFYVVVDGTGADDGVVEECDESNNDAATESAASPIPG